MAQPSYPGAPQQCPPSAPAYPQPGYGPPPAGYGQAPPGYGQAPPAYPAPSYPQPKPKKSKGFLGGLIDDVSKGFDSAARDIGGFAGKAYHGDIMNVLSTGNVVQMYYKKTGRTIQIVSHPTENRLIVDAMGYFSPQAYNAHWIVFRETGNIVKLYNQNNYLGVMNGQVALYQCTSPTAAPAETRWRVNQSASSEHEMSLSSMAVGGAVVAVAPDDRSVGLEQSTALSARTYFTVQFVAKIQPM